MTVLKYGKQKKKKTYFVARNNSWSSKMSRNYLLNEERARVRTMKEIATKAVFFFFASRETRNSFIIIPIFCRRPFLLQTRSNIVSKRSTTNRFDNKKMSCFLRTNITVVFFFIFW